MILQQNILEYAVKRDGRYMQLEEKCSRRMKMKSGFAWVFALPELLPDDSRIVYCSYVAASLGDQHVAADMLEHALVDFLEL